jgi:hypothetical protein
MPKLGDAPPAFLDVTQAKIKEADLNANTTEFNKGVNVSS